MIVDRKPFFDSIRKSLFKKGLRQSQVDGLQFLLNVWEQHYQTQTPITQLANAMGQTYLESAFTMQLIHEYGNREYFMRMYDKSGARPAKAAELGNTEAGDGAKFPGMGFIQSTGRANARRNTRKLRALGLIPADVDFEVNPELMMKPEYAVHILFLGMEEGWFTGRKLDDFVDANIDGDEHSDFFKARAIINPGDKAEQIANYSDAFLQALKLSIRTGNPAPVPTPTPAPGPAAAKEPSPLPPPPPPPAPGHAMPGPVAKAEPVPEVPSVQNPAPKGWFEHLLDLMRSHRGQA